jgi:cellulose synthase/poly-beta-1,6-N-acetylglucosamine synthase-like glycosyltransferase
MIFFLLIIAWLLAGGLGLLLTVLGLECLLALVPQRTVASTAEASAAVLIPAHNEAAGIHHTLLNVQSQLAPGDRILLVADNCNDATATAARDAGVEVLERFNTELRGKGFALEAGVRYLEQNPPEVVVILDADCELGPDALQSLVQDCTSAQRPVQARYLMRLPSSPGPETSVSMFAFLVKNWIRPRALHRVQLPVMLTGTGMAFGWKDIQHAPLATDEIVEDLALGLYFTRRGQGPVFCERAHVWSDLPSDSNAAIQQRTRWEHGYLGSILRDVPGIIRDAFRHRRFSLLLLALDLMVPPLALLAIVSILACAILALIALWTDDWGPLLMLVSAGLFSGLGITLAWVRFARDLIPAKVILAIPRYVLSKLNVYKRFVTHRQKEWIRTKRN